MRKHLKSAGRLALRGQSLKLPSLTHRNHLPGPRSRAMRLFRREKAIPEPMPTGSGSMPSSYDGVRTRRSVRMRAT